jgi:hypothetical protein
MSMRSVCDDHSYQTGQYAHLIAEIVNNNDQIVFLSPQ